MKTFLEFLENRNKYVINEAFKEKDVEKAIDAIDKILKKHINGLLPLVGFVQISSNNKKLLSKQYMVCDKTNPENTSMFQINFDQSSSSVSAYSIDFFKDIDFLSTGNGKSNLTLYTLGTSIVFFLPIIWEVVNNHNYSLSQKEAIELGRKVFKNNNVKESMFWYGGASYRIIEGLSENIINDTFNLQIKEDEKEDIKKYKKQKQAVAHDAYIHRKDSPEAKDYYMQVDAEYKAVKNAIAGGAETWTELKLATKANVKVQLEIDKELQKIEDTLTKEKEEHEDPDTVFKKMQGYVKMVIKGLTPAVILCGAPGVGKTYRVKQLLKANGYNEGHNLWTIKGKCTPRMLYLALFDHKEKKDIVLIDDADSLVGPGAPEDCINILKAALDSTSDDDGRLVSYSVSGVLKDDEGMEIPKRFNYNGGVIVITNWNAGKLDTALRGRSYVQDIHFTTEEILEIIKKLMPGIDPQHLSPKSKMKAYEYLIDLAKNKSEMEISIRTFGLCAKIYESCDNDPDFGDEVAQLMIKEQMRLQSLRYKGKGGKY